MKQFWTKEFRGVLVLFLGAILLFSSCRKNDCEDVICAPCPSSRLVIQYQDSTGMCDVNFDASAKIYAISLANSQDTAYAYDFSDSCKAGFLVQDDVEYHLVASNYAEVIRIERFTFQEPDIVTECCYCYPVDSVWLSIDGNTEAVVFPTGAYQNEALVRSIN